MEILSLYNWKPLKLISGNNISKIYKVEKEDGTIAVVKKITLPISDNDAALLMERGKVLFLQDATSYYMEMMNNEINILNQLSGSPNVLHIFDTHQENETGKRSDDDDRRRCRRRWCSSAQCSCPACHSGRPWRPGS